MDGTEDMELEGAFQEGIRQTPWYKEFKGHFGEDPNLETPDYDYRRAWQEGARPTVRDPGDGTLHWPSKFKGDNHPNRFIDGIDTREDNQMQIPGMPQGGMPPQGGGMPQQGGQPVAGGHGEGLAQQLMQLVQSSPKAQQMMQMVIQNMMSQGMGQGGSGQMPMPQGGGGDPREAMARMASEMQGGGMPANAGGEEFPPMGANLPMQDMPALAESEDPNGPTDEMPNARGEVPAGPKGRAPSTEDELDMVQQMMNRGSVQFEGEDAPTDADIEALNAEPTDTMVEAFDEHFGPGSAAKYMEQGGEGGPPQDDEAEGDEDY